MKAQHKLTGKVIASNKRLDCSIIDLQTGEKVKRCIVFFDVMQLPRADKQITVYGKNESNAFYVESISYDYNY